MATFLDSQGVPDKAERCATSQQMLVEAMLRFPWMAKSLGKRCGMTLTVKESGEQGLGHAHFQSSQWDGEEE